MFKISVMNNPFVNIEKEYKFLKSLPLDGIELTLEPPESYYDNIDFKKYKNKFIFGHTRCDLKFASEDFQKRNEAINEYIKCIDYFEKLGIKKINFHPDNNTKILKEKVQDYNIIALNKIIKYAKKKILLF
jgi:sugar phosphate isomerase/epimerase